MTINELRQKRAALIKQARDLVDLADRENRSLVQEEENQYSTIMAEVQRMADEIKRREDLEALEQNSNQPVNATVRPNPEPTGQRSSARDGDEYRNAYRTFLREGRNAWNGQEQRALMAGNDTLGGYLLAPTQVVRGILQAADDQVFIRQWADVQQVQGASDGLGLVSLDSDPADPIWTGEIGTGDEDSTMKFGKRELHPHPLAKRIKVSRKLLRKVPDVEALIIARFGYKFGTVFENGYLNGSGAKQPLGVFTASADGVPTTRDVATGNTATAITFDGLKEAKYTLKGQYWARARWMFHRDALKMLAKIKDGEGRYVWESSVRAGEPDRLLNFPVAMSEYVPHTFTTGLYVGILADWFYYKIADDLNMDMQRLDELYAETNQVGFIGRMESDGMPALAEAFVRVKLG